MLESAHEKLEFIYIYIPIFETTHFNQKSFGDDLQAKINPILEDYTNYQI